MSYVLPSGPSPCGRLSLPPSSMSDKTPQIHTAGFPFHSTFPPASACGLRRTFASKPFTDVLVLPWVIVKTLDVRENFIPKLYQHFRVRDYPYGLQDSLSTLHLFCSSTSTSATGARLDRVGWLTLTRQGLSP